MELVLTFQGLWNIDHSRTCVQHMSHQPLCRFLCSASTKEGSGSNAPLRRPAPGLSLFVLVFTGFFHPLVTKNLTLKLHFSGQQIKSINQKHSVYDCCKVVLFNWMDGRGQVATPTEETANVSPLVGSLTPDLLWFNFVIWNKCQVVNYSLVSTMQYSTLTVQIRTDSFASPL